MYNRANVQQPSATASRLSTTGRVSGRGALALNLPIAWRLTLGFVIAGLIAAAAAGVVGAQRAQALGQQSAFYQSLLQNSTSLATGDSYLQLMNTKVHDALDVAASPTPSTETLTSDEQDVPLLANYFDGVITGYATNDLLSRNANEVATLRLAGDTTSVTRQAALVSSALRTWRAYKDAQSQVLASIKAGNVNAAQSAERLAAEPTNADAQSALRALIQFNDSLAGTVRQAASAQEQDQTISAIIAALIAFAAVALVGWFISETIVRRLRSLRAVTKAVEAGRLDSRVHVVGRDEIGDVSASVNGMLDTIVGLLEETRRQRDALSNAAERLFSDMRVASGGDLRVSASVSSDPIGLLGNAFNLTIGRFKRFISRSRLATDQLDGLARQQVERADAFIGAVRRSASTPGGVSSMPSPLPSLAQSFSWPMSQQGASQFGGEFGQQSAPARPAVEAPLERAHSLTERLTGEEFLGRARRAIECTEQAYLSLGRVIQLLERIPYSAVETSGVRNDLAQEIRTLDTNLQAVGRETYTLNQAAPEVLDALRESLMTVESVIDSGAFVAAPQLGATPAQDTQVYEFVRLASSFAQEMSASARQLIVVAQEMRVNVTPFQLDSSSDMVGAVPLDGAYPPYSSYQGYQGYQGYPQNGGYQGQGDYQGGGSGWGSMPW
ncbi:MAG TPA: HAMP domain-containing protein [Ktedonobacterales bacterium]